MRGTPPQGSNRQVNVLQSILYIYKLVVSCIDV